MSDDLPNAAASDLGTVTRSEAPPRPTYNRRLVGTARVPTGSREAATAHPQEISGHSLTPDVREEFRENRPVTPDERRATLALWEDRKADPEWFARYQRAN